MTMPGSDSAVDRSDSHRVVVIGECMIELSSLESSVDCWRMRFAGDTLNTATYMARLGGNIAYLTAIGADRFSAAMLQQWQADGIDTSLVQTRPDRLPGLYAIETDATGERHFQYWRENSAARTLFDHDEGGNDRLQSALSAAASADLLYLSGITLSLFNSAGQRRLIDLCAGVRAKGGLVAFDPNYRARGWDSPDAARAVIGAVAPYVSIALPTFDDEASLYGDISPAATHARWVAAGAGEVVVKMGPEGALVDSGDIIAGPRVLHPLDTTGAGDAFNAAYLSTRLNGHDRTDAATAGNALAATVIQHPGAIIDQAFMNSAGAKAL